MGELHYLIAIGGLRVVKEFAIAGSRLESFSRAEDEQVFAIGLSTCELKAFVHSPTETGETKTDKFEGYLQDNIGNEPHNFYGEFNGECNHPNQ